MIDAKLAARVERAVLAGGGHSMAGIQTGLEGFDTAIFNTPGGQQLRLLIPTEFSDSDFSMAVKHLIDYHLNQVGECTINIKLSTLLEMQRRLTALSEEVTGIIEGKQ